MGDPGQVVGMNELEGASTDRIGRRYLGDVAPLLVDVLQLAVDRRPEHTQRQRVGQGPKSRFALAERVLGQTAFGHVLEHRMQIAGADPLR